MNEKNLAAMVVAEVKKAMAAIDGVRLRLDIRQPPHLLVGVQQRAEAAALQYKAGMSQPSDGHVERPPYFPAILTAVSRAMRIMEVKVVWRAFASSASPVTMLSEMEQMARARLPSLAAVM